MAKNLTSKELKTLHNTDFFLVKASATKKIEHLFAEVRDEIKSAIEENKIVFPKEVDATNGKIFRGENYQGLPYLVLDYPKHFSKDSVFAFRTMFWWGNFFSCTLHLQGKGLEHLTDPIPTFPKGQPKVANEVRATSATLPLWGRWRGSGVYICVNNNPWQYHYKKDNYLSIDKLSDSEIKKMLLESKFIKLSRKIPIKDHKKVVKFARESFLLLQSALVDKV